MTARNPEYFYKYRSMATEKEIKRVKEVVLGNELYYAAGSTFNDPFDLNPVQSLDAPSDVRRNDYIRVSRKFDSRSTEASRQAEADRVASTLESPDDLKLVTQAIQFMLGHILREEIGTYCVSAKDDDLLMWAHYADKHRGICLEFDGSSSLMQTAQPINYTGTREPLNHYLDSKDVAADKALLTKSEHWMYEDEFRLFRLDAGPGKENIGSDVLVGIVIGAYATSDTVMTVKEWNSERPNPLRVRRARLSNDGFSIVLEPLR